MVIPQRGGLPHSDIHGSTPARGSPWLFAACHVLHRLLVPRHPPNALLSLEITPTLRREGQDPPRTGAIHTLARATCCTPSHMNTPVAAGFELSNNTHCG